MIDPVSIGLMLGLVLVVTITLFTVIFILGRRRAAREEAFSKLTSYEDDTSNHRSGPQNTANPYSSPVYTSTPNPNDPSFGRLAAQQLHQPSQGQTGYTLMSGS